MCSYIALVAAQTQTAHCQVGNLFSGAAAIPHGFQSLPTGGGGYVTGLDVHRGNDSAVGGTGSVAATGDMVCRTDVGGAYRRHSYDTTWTPIFTRASLVTIGVTSGSAVPEVGVCDIQICPSNPNRYYMLCADPNTAYVSYRVLRSDDRGTTWYLTNNSFVTSGGFQQNAGGSMSASTYFKFSAWRLGIDPYNEDVVYIGSYPWNVLGTNGVYRTLNGGTTWSVVSDLPAPRGSHGVAGIKFDLSEGTVTVGGQTRAKRCLIPVPNQGIYETNDGNTFSKVASSADPTPQSTTASVTTTATDAVILVQFTCSSAASVQNVSASGAATISSFTLRSFSVSSDQQATVFTYWAVGTAIGTYNITVDFDDGASGGFGPSGQSVLPLAVQGADVSGGAATIFDVVNPTRGGSTVGAAASPAITVTNGALIFAAAFSNATLPATYSGANLDAAKYAFQVYKVETAGAKTVSINSQAWVYLVDAIKDGGGGLTIIAGTPHYNSGTAAGAGPSSVFTGDIDSTGTYWCASNHVRFDASNGGAYWRYKKGGTVEKLNGTGATANKVLSTFGVSGTPVLGTICCDPRPAHAGEMIFMLQTQMCQAQQTVTGNAAAVSGITWIGNTTVGTFTAGTADVPWLHVTAGAVGQLIIDVNGAYQATDGVMCYNAAAGSIWGAGTSPSFNVTRNIKTAGIEEMVAQDVIAAPGSDQPMTVYQDRVGLLTNVPDYPAATAFPGYQFSGYQGDWAGNNPNYYFIVARQEVTAFGQYLAYSLDYGVTWNYTSGQLGSPYDQNAQGGACAVLGYTNPTTASIVVAGISATFYSTDNGGTWAGVTGLPRTLVTNQQSRSRPIAGSKTTNNLGWAYADGYGLYRSTDGGANWSNVNASISIGTQVCSLYNVPGFPDDLFLSPSLRFQASDTILYCANATAVSPTFAVLNALCTSVVHFCLGKQESGGTYPTMWMLGVYNGGTFGWYKSIDKGVTWTFLAERSAVAPVNSIDYPQQIVGDWQRAGRFYQMYQGTSIGMYVSP